ncbi:MAG: hypothetical protein HY695_27755 [Deltaproteobacteria bacterium]|nr:hypothetical protein [Deltaproteobacteria bacterium]
MLNTLKILFLVFLFFSCSLPNTFDSRHSGDLGARKIRRIAVFPLDPVSQAEKDKIAYSAAPRPEEKPLQEGAPVVVQNHLYFTMSSLPHWQIISEREVREIISAVPPGPEGNRAKRLGELVYADAVIFTRLIRYRERVGEEWGAKSPASVAFVLDLWDVRRGDLIWSGRFDETQKSLSENIFAIGDYFQRGVKWLTAEQLALEGIKKAVNNLQQTLYRGAS